VIDVRPEVQVALREQRRWRWNRRSSRTAAVAGNLKRPGLPRPRCAQKRATPATIAVLSGRPVVGLTDAELEELARARDVLKASTRDLAIAVAGPHRGDDGGSDNGPGTGPAFASSPRAASAGVPRRRAGVGRLR
jgi:hypothetical protein